MHIDHKTKGKIWANEYVDLSSLLQSNMGHTEEKEAFRFVESTSGLVTLRREKAPRQITSLPQWFTAFHTFVAVYAEKFPETTPALMQYMETIRKLGQRAGDDAALQYDRTFRRLRQDNPSLAFESLHTDTYTDALAMGISRQSAQRIRLGHAFRQSKSPNPCYSFNNNNGKCTRKQRPYKHVCQHCSGPHSKKSCSRNQGQQKANPVTKLGAQLTAAR
ncbi:uncharacterized protein LOC128555703 [Mercenaria mercenaria]|uniref:uncharacterized protein LOC128555703 n=1 Tax=Mercenaria mercenaria TaxID=6596 RepID=UPI00234E5040|nr:uncharacterized protein LOC128555703 [Mercenaria mercenaria]